MLTPQFLLPVHNELVVDLFAGGGGASTGIEQAIGRPVDIAVNHDAEAVSLHTINHLQTEHYIKDVFEINPLVATRGQPVGMLWASPDCKHFSKAKGGKPVSQRIRGLAWVTVKWAKAVRPRVIILENVEEFKTWGPLLDSGMPCPVRKGQTFELWKQQLEQLGYRIEHKELRACDYGAPTIRKRFFMIARCDGQPIVWPKQTHFAKPLKGQKPWRTAAEIIDWSMPCPSIFERKKPLADATCRRIAKGIVRYVAGGDPFIVPLHGTSKSHTSTHDINTPLSTVSAQGTHHALVTAFLAKHYTGVVGSDLNDPIGTVTSIDHHSLITANLVHMGHGEGKCGTRRFSHGIRDVADPLNTVTASGSPAAIVTSHLVKFKNNQDGQAVTEPLPTLTAHARHVGEVRAFLIKYYGNQTDGESLDEPLHTISTRDRFGLVTVRSIDCQIVDIGLRMLTPRELYRAQGFPDDYIIDRTESGKPLTKTAQVRMVGNSVCPPLAAALARANYVEYEQIMEVA